MHPYHTRSKGNLEYTWGAALLATEPRRRRKQPEEMANQNANNPRLFGDFYEPVFDNAHITREIDAESYTIPPAIINLIQSGVIFQGLENEDPNAHIKACFIKLWRKCPFPRW